MTQEILDRVILILLLILAQLPVTYLVVKFLIFENGLFDGFRKLRHFAGIREYEEIDANGDTHRVRKLVQKRWLSQVLYCYNCLSPYVSLVVAIAAAHLASNVTEVGAGASTAKISEGFGLTLLGLVMWLPVTGLTIMAFDVIGTP